MDKWENILWNNCILFLAKSSYGTLCRVLLNGHTACQVNYSSSSFSVWTQYLYSQLAQPSRKAGKKGEEASLAPPRGPKWWIILSMDGGQEKQWNSNKSNGSQMLVVIKEELVVSAEIVMVMEGTNIFPLRVSATVRSWAAGWQAWWLMTTGCGAALQLDASSTPAHHPCWQLGRREREGRVLSLSLSLSLCLQNKTLTSTPWLPPLCLTSGHNIEPSASNSDRSDKATQMAWTHPSSGPVTQSLLYFST